MYFVPDQIIWSLFCNWNFSLGVVLCLDLPSMSPDPFDSAESSTLAVLIPPRRATERDVSAFLRRRAVEESHREIKRHLTRSCRGAVDQSHREIKSAEAESSRRARETRSRRGELERRGAVEESHREIKTTHAESSMSRRGSPPRYHKRRSGVVEER